MLIKYTFYKNVMYMITWFYFGFYSGFSGQPMYEPLIYQLYNITMTSIPIMYFALFDFEYTKQTFMKKPKLYKIGMSSSCFSYRIFGMWLVYAMIHGFIIYQICFGLFLDTNLSSQVNNDG